MASDDELIDDGGDLIDDDESSSGDDIIIEEDDIIHEDDLGGGKIYDITRAYKQGAGVTAKDRSYTEVSAGKITFGYRNVNSGTRNPVYIIQSDSTYSGSSTYRGISCNARQIKIIQEATRSGGINLELRVGGYRPGTGYLHVVTNMKITRSDGVEWTIERIPFQNGICVLKAR